jgi:hypothetical protein
MTSKMAFSGKISLAIWTKKLARSMSTLRVSLKFGLKLQTTWKKAFADDQGSENACGHFVLFRFLYPLPREHCASRVFEVSLS